MTEIKLKIASVVIGSGEGGGSGVAPYYADLPDKPTINGEILSGAMTSEDLGLASSSQSVPTGGTTGQVLAKKSNADNDVQWVNQEDGGTDDYADLTNKPQINSVALSGNKSASELGLATAAQGALAASAYQKPQTGIPSTDLASGVQTSLGKADTAVQSVTVGTTTTGNAGANASVTNSGTQSNPVFDFTIPRGADGSNAVNPFKGYYPSTKPTGDFASGDYIYAPDTTDGSTTVIWYWGNNDWNETTIDVSDVVGVEFANTSKAVAATKVVNDCTTGGVDDVLSAEQGKIIGNEVNGKVDNVFSEVETEGLTRYDYIITSQNTWSTQSGAKHIRLNLASDAFVGAKVVKVKANETHDARVSFLVTDNFSDGGTPDFVSNTLPITIAANETMLLVIPQGTGYVIINGGASNIYIPSYVGLSKNYVEDSFDSSDIDRPLSANRGRLLKAMIDNINLGEVKVVEPLCSYFGVKLQSDSFMTNNYNREIYSTTRYISLLGSSFELKVSESRYYAIVFYDEDFSFLGSTGGYIGISADTWTTISTVSNTKYIKINLAVNQTPVVNGNADAKTRVWLRGSFDENTEVFNKRPNTVNGYLNIAVPVNLTNPTSCDDDSNDIQDQSQYSTDFGILYLPTTYSNTGIPTRLIIYCHGANVNYTSSVNPNTDTDIRQDLEPEYWLAEGYAVMDMEGNPFNNSDEHFCIPQARESYIAAYKWVIDAFNIRKDGVFLGGRSMGGYMVAELMRSNIPVIAACPNVPCMDMSFVWHYMSPTRKAFCATHMGFSSPQPAWSSSSKAAMTSTEWEYLKANFNKAKNFNPWYAFIENLPTADVFLNDDLNVSVTSENGELSLAIYENLHMKFPVPVKLFVASGDTVAIPTYNWMGIKAAAEKCANIFEVRVFDTTNHHYDTQEEALQKEVTTTYGGTITTSVVYVEMLQFWRRYEQDN